MMSHLLNISFLFILLLSSLQEIFHVNEYLRVLNGKLANVTSLILFIFIQGVVFCESK